MPEPLPTLIGSDVFGDIAKLTRAVRELQKKCPLEFRRPLFKVGETLFVEDDSTPPARQVIRCVPIDGETVPTMSGMGRGFYDNINGNTIITLIDPLFSKQIASQDIVVDGVGTLTIASVQTPYQANVFGNHAFNVPALVTLPQLSEMAGGQEAWVDAVDFSDLPIIPGPTRTASGVYCPIGVRASYPTPMAAATHYLSPWTLHALADWGYGTWSIVAALTDPNKNYDGITRDRWFSDSPPSTFVALVTAFDAITSNYTADITYAPGKTLSIHATVNALLAGGTASDFWPPVAVNDVTEVQLIGGRSNSAPFQETFPPRIPLSLFTETLLHHLAPGGITTTVNTGRVTAGGTTGQVTTINGVVTAVVDAT